MGYDQMVRTVSRLVLIISTICIAVELAPITSRAVETNHRAFVIRNVRIFDGGEIIPANSVAVIDGKIAIVGNNIAAPPGAEIIDGRGDTLLPGLIDSHVHIWLRELLRMGLVTGVTTELDMYMRWEQAQQWKKEESRAAFDLADFRTAGTCFAVAGGHGTEADLPPIVPIRTPNQAQAFVDERIAHGSDYIKVMYDNGPRFAAMPKEVLEAIVKAAHRRGKMVIVHVFSPQGILDVINAGADGLAHVPIVKLPEPAFADALKTHPIFAITTLGFTDFHFGTERLATKMPDDPFFAPYLRPRYRQALAQPAWNSPEPISYAANEAALRILHAARVPILAGTDSINDDPVGAVLDIELELMVKAGLTPSEALADATSVPAKVFGLTDRGRIAPGLRADLLLVHGDPTRDIRTTREIVAIWKQGARVDRDSVREEIAQENAAWRLGAGWMPLLKAPSRVTISTVEGGPNQARIVARLDGEVKPGEGFLYAGIEYVPTLAYPMANQDLSGIPQISFWARGDGKTYAITLYPADGTPTTKYFIASKDWAQVKFRFSDFGGDGKKIAMLQIVSSTLGPFHLELADTRIGAHRWLGVVLGRGTGGVQIDSVDRASPADAIGLQPGDAITGFDGKPVKSDGDVITLLAATLVGDKVPIEIERGGKTRKMTIEVAAHPG